MSMRGGDGQRPEPEHQPPSLAASWANFRQPGSVGWKIRRTVGNTLTKIVRRQSCCGNDGEPGC